MSPEGPSTPRVSRRPTRVLVCAQILGFAGVLTVIGLTASSDDWNLALMAGVLAFAVISDLSHVDIGSSRIKVSGSFLGIVLAAVLMGGGPAAVLGVLTIAIGWFGSREPWHYLRNNLLTFAWASLLAGLFFHWVTTASGTGPEDALYYVFAFATFGVGLAVDYVMVAGYQCYLDRSSFIEKSRETLAPLLAAELFSALLTMAGVFVAARLGTIGLAPFALVLGVFQHLVGELLTSKERSEALRRLAITDELTGLPNRSRFRDLVERQIALPEAETDGFAVMLVDLDRFKEINDTLGHHYGDLLLKRIGTRFNECAGAENVVARLGGDEFAVLCGLDRDRPIELELLAARLLACAQEPLSVEELSLEIGASIGIARYPRDGRDAHTLLRRADVAMYAAKRDQSGFRLYAPSQDHHARRQLSVVSDFRRALSSGEIVVHYQPIVELEELRVRGAEGLVRWEHPERGLLPPGAFMEAVERTHLIGPLTHHVLDSALAQCAEWRASGMDLSVAVNLSVRNLLDRNLPRQIDRLLSTHGLEPDALQLEITESMIMADPERALATVSRLSGAGIRISVDDFGTGYSSLENLRRLPIDELKIDRSFVTPMLNDKSDLIIVRSTINLAHDLGLRIIAEGVEDAQTLDRLAALGCDLAQGFHLSRPMSPENFTGWIEQPLDPTEDERAA
jgi:diguanylate cyclase (GGDEF)-like protein